MTSTTRQPRRQGPREVRSSRYPVPQPQHAAVPRGQTMPQVGGGRTPARTHRRVREHRWDSGILFAVTLLLVIGLVALFSASYSVGYYNFKGDSLHFVKRQGVFAAAGFAAMIAISKIPYQKYAKYYKVLMYLSIGLLVLVLIPGIGRVYNGARRWLFNFQPSELAKLSIIVCFSYWVSRAPQSVRHLRTLIYPYGVLFLVYAGLLMLEPHNSAMMIIGAIGVCILAAGGMQVWFLPIAAGLGAGLMTAAYFMSEHVRTRFAVWFNPFADMADKGYQASMSQIAIGSGGLLGLGLGNGRQKHLYLPEPQNDFIFSSWCEEMGFLGALLVIALFAFLIYRGFRVARAAPDRLGALMATGITAKLAIQTLMNLFVVTGIMPVTGASLPFFSYGGTALLMQLGEMGILLNISRYMRIEARQES